jgi:hypothetical protein
MTTAMAEFRDARYWLVSGGRFASLGNWSEALERCERALAAASGAGDAIRPSPIPKQPANLTTNDWPQVQREARFLRAQVLWRLGRTNEAQADHVASRFIPARSLQATLRQLDLTSFYNARLDDDWHLDKTPVPKSTLETLPTGLQDFDKITFDVRGLIQLGGSELRLHGRRYPERVMGIPVGQSCRRIHFLHATLYGASAGEDLGEYSSRYTDGQTARLTVRYGENVADWWEGSLKIPDEGQSYRVAWKGANDFARSRHVIQRLYHAIWENPRPEVPVTSLNLVSRGLKATPFIVAITVEP